METETSQQRIIVWFSCGAASAVAARCALHKYPHNRVHLVYCDTSKSESTDNPRFMRDVEKWLNFKVTTIASTKYESIDDVFKARRYLAGIKGAPCTVEMKKVPRFDFQYPDDIHIFGLTADEEKRIRDFENNNPELNLDWILSKSEGYNLSKDDCLAIISTAGIKLPILYRQGYRNNNCIGCVKATSIAYWKKVRADYPEVFARRVAQSREYGVRLTRLKGERIFLDEIPMDDTGTVTDANEELENISCGPECGGDPK